MSNKTGIVFLDRKQFHVLVYLGGRNDRYSKSMYQREQDLTREYIQQTKNAQRLQKGEHGDPLKRKHLLWIQGTINPDSIQHINIFN